MKLSLEKKEKIIVLGLFLIGLMLRFLPDPHRLIWSYDQARDSFFMREMVKNLNIILLGAQTEHYGLFHGPIYYYLFAPFYFLAKGGVALPIFLMTFLNLGSALIISFLASKMTKNKLVGVFTFAIFSLSYPFIEYSRWLSNVSLSLFFLSFSYLFFYKVLEKGVKKDFFLLGLFVGLTTQAELFFLSFAFILFWLFIFQKRKIRTISFYIFGLFLGGLPLLVSEIKFGFRGSRILFEKVLFLKPETSLLTKISQYLSHLALATNQTLAFPIGVSLIIFLFLVGFILWSKIPKARPFFGTILVSHLLLFGFSFIDAVFLDLGVVLILPLLFAVFMKFLFEKKRALFFLIFLFFLFGQKKEFDQYMLGERPFNHYGFIQEPSTLVRKERLLSAIYKYADGEPFTFASIGTPYGVRTVWASVFELYSRKSGVKIPKWYGYYANGYLGEELLMPADKPGSLHVLVLEDNKEGLLAKPIIEETLGNQNTHTKVVDKIDLYGTIIEFRRPK